MFDPQTARLIRSAPALRDLDLERLPQRLTDAFTAIVSFRVRMNQVDGALPETLRNQLDEFRRLANTFESLVVLLPLKEDREAAAYVAAQGHHLLMMARRLGQEGRAKDRHLSVDAISSTLSSLLLFLIADQPSDSMDLVKFLREGGDQGSEIEKALVEALALLGEGKPLSILDIPTPELGSLEDVEEQAGEALFLRIFKGVRFLGARLSGTPTASFEVMDSPASVFQEVQDVAIGDIEQTSALGFTRNPKFRVQSAYPGPHHLAALLNPASTRLEECATVNLPTPPGSDAILWGRLRQSVVRERPFLWRNHRDAISKGFLDVGTSAVVSFPTGAGKTTLSELKIASSIAGGGDVLYIAPTHALVAQAKHSFQQTFPELTVGDSLVAEDLYVEIGENALHTIAVLTPERCLALVSLAPDMFAGVRLVIFDECHLLHPQASGRTRRSVDAMLAVLHLARVAPKSDWLLLSAMMANADELAGWIAEFTGRRCLALNLDWKPTRQARGCLVFKQGEIDRLQRLVREEQAKSPRLTPPGEIQSLFQAEPFGLFCLEQTWQSQKVRDYSLQPLLEGLVSFSVGKANGKADWQLNPNKSEIAAHLAARCVERGLRVLLFGQTIPITTNLAGLMEERLQTQASTNRLLGDEEDLKKWAITEVGSSDALYCTANNIAGCHHGEMLAVERELVERLFRRPGGIRALAATTTLAQGVNLPADIVFIVGDARWDASDRKSQMLEAHELLNAAGRAGRAGQVAQGLVVILPNFLVGFDLKPKSGGPKIGKGWTALRSGIFSKPDQCLSIQDPVQMILDLLQDVKEQDNPEVLYFLRRLPRGTLDDPAAPETFLRSSLAGYHSRRSNSQADFERKLKVALDRRDSSLAHPEEFKWQVELACRAGVNPDLIVELDRDLLALGDSRPVDVEGWLRWFCGWLGEAGSPRRALLRHEPASSKKKEQQLELFGDRLFEVTWAWMTGVPLTHLEIMLGAKQDKLGKCPLARKFALRRIPDIAYAIGLVTQVYRRQLELGLIVGRMPVALGVISLCIRTGQSSPEELATRYELNEPLAARRSVAAIWRACQQIIKAGEADEPFVRTRGRVADALAQVAPPSFFVRLLTNIHLNETSFIDEMPWDDEAREAVKLALKSAVWDKASGTITLIDPDEPTVSVTVTNRENLEEHLRSIANDAFYANCSRDDGEFVAECDDDEIVENALAKFEDRLSSFFKKKPRGRV